MYFRCANFCFILRDCFLRSLASSGVSPPCLINVFLSLAPCNNAQSAQEPSSFRSLFVCLERASGRRLLCPTFTTPVSRFAFRRALQRLSSPRCVSCCGGGGVGENPPSLARDDNDEGDDDDDDVLDCHCVGLRALAGGCGAQSCRKGNPSAAPACSFVVATALSANFTEGAMLSDGNGTIRSGNLVTG